MVLLSALIVHIQILDFNNKTNVKKDVIKIQRWY